MVLAQGLTIIGALALLISMVTAVKGAGVAENRGLLTASAVTGILAGLFHAAALGYWFLLAEDDFNVFVGWAFRIGFVVPVLVWISSALLLVARPSRKEYQQVE